MEFARRHCLLPRGVTNCSVMLPQAVRAERFHERAKISGPSLACCPTELQRFELWVAPAVRGASLVSWGNFTVTRLAWHEGQVTLS